jgi:hypothetical protein
MLKTLFSFFFISSVIAQNTQTIIYTNMCKNRNHSDPSIIPQNNCVSFTVSQGTGCAWMCSYCADKLGPNYYFTDNICKYQSGGCTGNPMSGVTYTCCST